MNKIFKVIWSKSKQCYIVVSEMAKNHSGKKKIVVASILAAMAVGSDALVTDVSAARASVSLAGGNTVTDGTIAIGSGSYSDGTAIGGDGARRVEPGIAIGVDAKAQGNSNIVMGQGAQIIGHSFGVAIGRTAQATDDYGVSVGYNTQADLHGIAMGEQSRAKKTGATSFGVSSRGYGNGAIAVGWQSLAGANVYNENGVPNNDINTDNGKTINDYDKWGDVAIGVRTIATGGNATALGRGATASAANAIAIGGGDGGEPTPAGNTASDNKEKTKATAEKAVAIGYKALASDKNATSIGTDAQATQARATAIGYEVRAVGKNAVAIGSSGENSSRKLNSAGENAISIGTAAQANNLGSTAIGNLALASSNNAVAIGTSAEGTGASSTAIGHLVKATESNAFAAGSESLASGKNSISIGSTFNNITNQSTGEASIAIGAAAQSTGAGSVALGRNVQSLKEYTTAVGMNIKASDNASASTILGYNSYTKANQSVNIGSTVKTEAGGQYSTAIGYTLSVSGKNAIGIGSSDDGIADDKKLMATGESSIAIGTRAQGKASGATAIGKEAVASHTDAIALGTSAQGTGEASTAIGNGAKATNSHAFAAGVGASAAGNSAIAVGNSASAAKDNSVAIGTDTTASEIETVAVGLRASAQGKRSVSLGIDTESTTADGVSVGYLSKSKALGAVAIGRNAVVTAEKSTAVGYDLTVSNSASTNIGYTSTVAANQATSVGARNSVEAGAQYGTALGYFVNISGKNAIGIGSSDDKQNVVASAYNSAAIGTSAQATASSAMALGTNANAALAHSVALGEGSTTTTDDGASKIAYLTNESTNNSGNGVISVGNKRNTSDTGTITRRIVSVAGGTDDFDAVNVKQLKALESKERHIKVKTGNDAYTPDANGKITLNYVNGKGEDVPNEVTEIKDVAKKSDEWTLRTQDGNTTAVATPQTVNGLTKKAVTLKAGDNIAIENNNGVVTIKAKDVVKSVATDNTNALDISNTNGAVKINPKLASSVNAAGEANKLVTAGTVKTALDDKIDKTAEMHIKSGEYTVNTDGTASLIQQNGNNQDQSTRVTIKDIAKKSVVDTLQSDYNTFRTKAITFTGDDNQGVARTLDTTLTVKGGANYTSTTTNTNIRVEKDGTTGLAVKLSDKLTGMKEISGTGSQDLVINNGNTKVTVKAPSNGDNGTVDFGNAKVVASNLDASIKYRANDEAAANAKSVKLADGFNFVASKDATTTAEGPKSGLAIKAEDNGKVTFGLDKATREKVDNAADKNLSNLSDTGKDKVKELAKTAAQDAVKVANGINTTVEKDTATAGVTTYKVNANDTTVAVTGNGLAITGGELGTDKVRKYSLDLSAATKGKLAAVGNLATNVIGGTTIAADGTVTGPTFSITKADGTAENAGTIKEAIEKLDAANKGQNTKISDTADKVTKLATALGGGAKVENGTFTGPTYNITKADGSGTETASNVGDAISKLDTRITTANGTLVTKGLDFTGNDTTNVGKVHRDLGTTLTIKGTENFTRAATETNNIKVVKNGDALDVKLAENLAKMKEISGDGTSDLVIKNGDTKVTVKAPTSGDKGTVDFGDAKVVASNLDANIAYKANKETAKKTVKLQDGFNFTAATDTAADTNVPKSGLAITTGDNGVVTFGLDKATREKVDNAADKNLSNLSDTGKNTVKELAKGAAQDAVKVADGINTTVEKDTATAGVTTYKVNANDTTVAVTGDGLAITGGDLGTDKVRKYSLDLSAATKGKLAAIGNLATNVIGGTTISANGTVTGPTFSITNATGTAENAGTIKEAIEKLDAANKGQNTKISETESKVKDIVDKGMTFAGDDAAADKVTRKLGETLNIHGQNNITVKKDGTAEDTLNVKLASDLKNITSITNADADGKPGSKITLGADGVSIANTAAGQGGAAGETKTVTIGKDGINAGGMKITNVAEAKAAGDAANKKYVDDAISNLGNIVSGNATLNFAGNVTKDAQDQATEKVGLSLATGTLHVNGANNEITTTAKGDTITVGLAETVKSQLAKVGDTASNGRDGKDGTSGAQGLTGKDGLNDKTLTDKVNALRNGEAGSVVYTDENGARLVKAKDGEYYKATDVDATGNVLNGAKKATTVEARVVNPDGTTTGGTTKLSNIADGKVAAGSKDAVNGGQLNTVKTDLANALGGGAKVENGTFTGPTYNITKDDGSNTKEAVNNVGDAISKLDGRINNANTVLGNKGLDFYGNKDTADTDKVHRNLGEALKVKGAENFTRAEGAKNNIDVVKNTAGDGFDVKLAENLANMKEISGNGKDNLVIKNGDATITLKPKKEAEGTNPATPATVDFGETKVVASNLDASIKYRANDDAANAKSVKLADGFNFVASKDATTTAEGPKSGLAISAEDNGKVTFGLDKATRSTIDNAADKNLSNLSDTGKTTVKELAKGAAQDAVKVADGINTTVEKDTTTTAGVTTYKVNANDTTVAVTGNGLAITGGDLGTDKVRKYSLDLSDATKGKLKAVDGLSTVIGGTNITTDGTVTGPTFNITKADGTTEEATTIKDAIDKLNATNAGQNTKINDTAEKVTTLDGKVKGIVDKGMTFAGDDAATDKVTRKLGETLNIHGQNNITVKKDGTAEDTLNVKLASDLKNITSITNADADGKPGSKITLGADGVSIANTAAGADGAAGATKTVTIGKYGINAGGMKITNVTKAEADGDAANKKYVDDAISNLGNIVSGNATLNFAGNVTKNAQDQATEKVGLSLATGTLHVNGANNEITTTAKGDTITVGLAETVKSQLAKVGDTASNGRDGKDGTSGPKGLTGKDGLNDKTLTDKVNALRNGEAGSVVYTDENGARLVKAKDGEYYKAADVDATGNVLNGATKATTVEARVVNPDGTTTGGTTKLSNIADGKVAAGSKDAVNGGQLHTVKSDLATALGGDSKVNADGSFTGPTYNITKDDGSTTKEAVNNVGDAISKLDTRITTANGTLVTKGLDFTGNDTTDAGKVHRDLGTTLTIKGAENFTRTDAETNNIKVVKNNNDLDVKLAENLSNIKSISNATGAGKPGSTITLGADGVSIANTAAGQGGAVGETKTVTIGKDGINAGGMKITNVTKAEADGDAANKKYVDDAISNLNTTVTNNANLRYAGDTNEGAGTGEDHLNLPLATGTLKVAGTADQIKTVANNGTITLSLDEKVTNKLDKLGDTASNGRDGVNGTSGATGLTGKDGLNDKTLTDKVNALRNGEAGSVVYTNDAGDRVVKAKDGKYYKADEVKADGTVKTAEENKGKKPEEVKTPQARVVNPNGETTAPTTLSNIADGKVVANSKDAVNGGQLHTAKSEIGAIIGGTTINENGKITGPTFSITNAEGTAENAGTIKEAIEKLDATNKGQNTKISETAGKVTALEGKVDGIVDKGMVFAGDDATADKVTRKLGETLNIHGQNNITVKKDGTAEDTLNVKLASDLKNITSITNADADGKPGSKITLGANGVSIANTAAGADGAAGETKTVTIGKDGINAGGMKITNVTKAEADGDAANKKYVDDAISNLNTTVTNNANLRYAGDTNEGAVNGEDHLNLPLATGTLKVAGTADQIKTVANNGTITLSLDEKVTNKLAKLGDTASNGRDGANGLTGKDGLNDKTLTEKVNALRNGEAGTVVYTDDAGERLVKANDGKYYHKDDLKADGTPKTADENNGTAPKAVDNPQARVVNGNGETTVPTTLSNIADGKVAANSKDAVNGGQLNTVKTDLATALGGGAKVENGTFTGPTYNITKDDGSNTKEAVNNVGDAISKLDGRINNANTALGNKGLDFYGNKDAADTDKVHRNLGEALKVKGAENFTREANAKNNIDIVKNTAGDGFDVKLAENLGNIKEIAGNGKDNLVIKNGDATITLKPKKEAEGTNPATPATVDFGDTKVVASNLDASIKYRANDEAATNAKSVKLADGFNFVASTDTTTTADGPKSGLAITAEDNGKVTFGLDKATREKVDNAADKNLSNLSDAGKDKVKELAGEAAKAAVTVADGINTTVTTDTTTTPGVTTYKVNANDTTVAVNADTLAISGGTPDATTKVRAYTLDLSDTVKAKLNAINNVGDTASNGRDGVNGTSGAKGLTGKDGLNDKTLTEKVNALRNGEAGSVVYTNDAGDRVVKAKDGKYYKADEVKADGTVKTAEENNGKKPEEVTTLQARVVNPNGETTAPTTLSNIADGKVAADSKEAVNGGQLNTVKTDLATALGGGAKVENGTFTGPTYNITKDDGSNTTEPVKNVGDAISKLDGRINNANTALANKGLDFTGNDTTDAGKVHRNLGETLTIKGADNFTRTDAETNNIKVVKNNNDLDVKLAENLGNIKEIAGNGKDNLVIKNGDATITLKPKKDAEGTNPATPATVDFGNTKVVAPNLEVSITYRANSAEDADAKTVTLQKGLNFVSGDGTAATAEAAKAGITIAADKDGKVVFGLNEATRNAIDNAADKNLSNLSQDGKDKVADLAKTAARDAVKVTAGNNVTVTSETKDGNTTYTVNGRDTTVKAADNGSISVTGGTLNAKGEREYTVDLTADAKAELGKISDLNTRLGSAEGKITTLQGDMTKAKDDIAANTKAIDANKEGIAANKNAIADNARDIAANRKDIDANTQGIAENKKQIGENTAAIGKNAENIKKNAQDIKKNEDAIQSNTKAIGANTTAIAKNANDITKANKEIESLKGNSATKDLSNLTNTGKDTITNLINVTGEHGITVTPSTDTTTRVKTFTAKLNDTVTFGSGDKKITVDGTTGTVTSKAVATDTVKANTVNAKTVQLGDSTGTNTTVTADGITVTTKNPDGTTSKVEIKNGTVSGLTNTKWDPAKVVTEADRSVVATQGQVKDVTDTLARGRVFVGDTGKTVTVGLGDTLAIKGGATGPLTDDNIGVVSTEAKDGKPATMTLKLAKDVKMKDGSTSYDYYLPEIKTNPDGSKEIVKNADGSVKHQLGKDGNPIRLVTTTVNGEGITIAPVKGLDKPTVSLTADGLDNGGNQIHNVAAGTLNTDAATVGQVRAAAHALNNRVNEAGAHAAALAAMNPLSYDPLKKSQVMAGVGSYKGNKALALGVAHYANEDTLFNVGVAVGDGSNMVNAGVTYRFGGEYSAVPERYKGGPISSVYVMQDEVSALKAENAEMKEQMKMLMERIEMLAAKA